MENEWKKAIADLKAKFTALREENERLTAQLPEGMKHCTIVFIECPLGHGRLTAKNWVDHGCPTCALAAALLRAAAPTPAPVATPDATSVPTEVHERGWQWRPTATDSAFAPPFGTIRACNHCGCLVAGGPSVCVRCTEPAATPDAREAVEPCATCHSLLPVGTPRTGDMPIRWVPGPMRDGKVTKQCMSCHEVEIRDAELVALREELVERGVLSP